MMIVDNLLVLWVCGVSGLLYNKTKETATIGVSVCDGNGFYAK